MDWEVSSCVVHADLPLEPPLVFLYALSRLDLSLRRGRIIQMGVAISLPMLIRHCGELTLFTRFRTSNSQTVY